MNEQEALEQAIVRERNAHRFYSEAAARATNVKGRRMFDWLASEEMGHIGLLEKQCDAFSESGTCIALDVWMSGGDISEPIDRSEFPSMSEAERELEPNASELEILKQSIEREKEDVSFYTEAAEAASDENAKALLGRLAEVERGHIELLEEEYEWLSRAQSMFTIHRFPPQRPFFEQR